MNSIEKDIQSSLRRTSQHYRYASGTQLEKSSTYNENIIRSTNLLAVAHQPRGLGTRRNESYPSLYSLKVLVQISFIVLMYLLFI